MLNCRRAGWHPACINGVSEIALQAAKNGTVALLSYSPDSLDKDFASAKIASDG